MLRCRPRRSGAYVATEERQQALPAIVAGCLCFVMVFMSGYVDTSSPWRYYARHVALPAGVIALVLGARQVVAPRRLVIGLTHVRLESALLRRVVWRIPYSEVRSVEFDRLETDRGRKHPVVRIDGRPRRRGKPWPWPLWETETVLSENYDRPLGEIGRVLRQRWQEYRDRHPTHG